MSATFYLGTHEERWLSRTDVPLFVSRRRLARRKKLPRASCIWALDSGGFTELSMYGAWQTPAAQYVAEVRRYRDEVGGLQWAAIQDWMCEPWVVAKTGLSVEEHQRRTVDSYETLLDLAPEVPWVPVLQGWALSDYWRHLEAYEARGHQLASLKVVGLGSVCRRQHMDEVASLIEGLTRHGLRLHGFGFKTQGLLMVGDVLASADSLAWSLQARRGEGMPGCTHRTCANCLRYALHWRSELLARLARPRSRQLGLFPTHSEAA